MSIRVITIRHLYCSVTKHINLLSLKLNNVARPVNQPIIWPDSNCKYPGVVVSATACHPRGRGLVWWLTLPPITPRGWCSGHIGSCARSVSFILSWASKGGWPLTTGHIGSRARNISFILPWASKGGWSLVILGHALRQPPLSDHIMLTWHTLTVVTGTRANTTPSTNVGLMLAQRRRRWANIKPTLDQRLVFAGTVNAASTPQSVVQH